MKVYEARFDGSIREEEMEKETQCYFINKNGYRFEKKSIYRMFTTDFAEAHDYVDEVIKLKEKEIEKLKKEIDKIEENQAEAYHKYMNNGE